MKCILLSLHNLISYTRLDFKLSTSPSSRIWLNHLLQQTRNSQKRSNNNPYHSIKNWSFPQPRLESILKSWLLLRMPLLLQRVSHSDKSRSIEWELRPWLSCLTHRTGFIYWQGIWFTWVLTGWESLRISLSWADKLSIQCFIPRARLGSPDLLTANSNLWRHKYAQLVLQTLSRP